VPPARRPRSRHAPGRARLVHGSVTIPLSGLIVIIRSAPVSSSTRTGLLTLAVVTAQVASSFVAQATRRPAPGPQAETPPHEVTLAEIDRRLTRIETLLTEAIASPAPGTAGTAEQDASGGPP
jgi:hypothetical protein